MQTKAYHYKLPKVEFIEILNTIALIVQVYLIKWSLGICILWPILISKPPDKLGTFIFVWLE